MFGLEHTHVLMIVTAFLFMTTVQTQLCTPGEEKQPHNITFNRIAYQIRWCKDNLEIVLCEGNSCQPQLDIRGYTASASSQTSTLFISNVTRDSEATYTCESGENKQSCDLKVFARAQSVSCEQAVLQADIVTVVCTVTRIFPKPVCQFAWSVNGAENHSLQETLTTYENQTENGTPVYFSARCRWKLPARIFSVGTHQFLVRVYPNVTANVSDSVYGTNSSWTFPQYVAIPSFKLESCPDTGSYVAEGKTFSCTCRETANNFTLSNTTLSYGTTRNSSTQNVTGSFTANRNIQELTCEAQLPNGTNNRITQTIQVAYGPNNVSMRVIYNQTESDAFSLCDQSLTVTATCIVPANNFNPGVNYMFYSNVTDTAASPSNMNTVNYTVRRGGLFSFLCTANNSQFAWLSNSSMTKIIQVTEPPDPPVIEYQDGGTPVIARDTLTVEEGVAKIRCRVEEGYPPVSGLLLECGSQSSKNNNESNLDVHISRNMDGTTCSCTANHSSPCYTNNKTLTRLNVHFGPDIFSFEVNNNSQQIIVEKSSIVSFSCQAEGNPSPRLSLRKNGAEAEISSDTTLSKFNQTLTYSKSMTDCLDTGVYFCLAVESQKTTNKTVAVYVKCKPDFRNPDNLIKIHKLRVNGTVSINVPVFGYPEPNVTLTSTKYKLSSDDYNLTYLQQEPPYGNVSLTINIINSTYFQNYILIINNTEGPLNYSFQIVDGDPKQESVNNGSPTPDVGAIVGGIVAALLFIAIICVIIFFLKRNGAPCNRNQQNGSTLMKTPNGSHSSVNHHGESGDAEVTVDNSDLYNWRSDEVEVDNIYLYNLNHSTPVEVDNSDLYNRNRPTPAIRERDSKYKKYSEVTPTITSATSLPLNMRTNKTESTSNPYEDVSSGEISKTKPPTPQKTKPPTPQKTKPFTKPKTQSGKPEGKQAKNTAPDQTYATVLKLNKSDKPFAIKEEKDEFFLDLSLQPEIPEKNFENPYEDTNNEKIPEKKSSGRKKNKAGKPKGKASEQPTDLSSVAYTNSGFSNPDDEGNVYANTAFSHIKRPSRGLIGIPASIKSKSYKSHMERVRRKMVHDGGNDHVLTCIHCGQTFTARIGIISHIRHRHGL